MAYLPDMREKYSIPEEVKEEKYNEVEVLFVLCLYNATHFYSGSVANFSFLCAENDC